MKSRRLHRLLALPLFAILFISAATGLAYRVGKKWFGIDGQTGQAIMEVHSGAWLGPVFGLAFILAAGLGLLALTGTGAGLILRSRAPGARRFHRWLGALLLLPLTATALTGLLFVAGHRWLGFSEQTSELLMTIHEGGWLGPQKVWYVLVLGCGLLALGLSGTRLFFKRTR